MRSLVLALLLLVFGTPAAVASPVSPNIIEGEPVAESRWVVGVYYDDEFFCSASIIAPRWVITARHCLFNGYTATVRVGSVKPGEGTPVTVARTHNSAVGDISLLELESDVEAEYVKLATEDPQVGETHHIYGWGADHFGGHPLYPVLKRAAVDVVGITDDEFGGLLVESTWNTGSGAHGDSGGPQINENGTQVGVCAMGDGTNVWYTSIAFHRDWIRQISGV